MDRLLCQVRRNQDSRLRRRGDGVPGLTAGEGGAWGVALLAAYLAEQKGESLEDYLNEKVFAGNAGERMTPDAKDVEGFAGFMDRYQKGLAAQRGAVDNLL